MLEIFNFKYGSKPGVIVADFSMGPRERTADGSHSLRPQGVDYLSVLGAIASVRNLVLSLCFFPPPFYCVSSIPNKCQFWI